MEHDKLQCKIGIRLEDKKFETRAPLTPFDVQDLLLEYPWMEIHVQKNRIADPETGLYPRTFPDADYETAGASIKDDLEECSIILGIKEIPKDKIMQNKAYVFFSHTFKGQPYNRTMFMELIAKKCTLIDYEMIVEDEAEQKYAKTKRVIQNSTPASKFGRTVMFGKHAGVVGAIDSIYAFSKRWEHLGIETPFHKIRLASDYRSTENGKEEEFNHTTGIHDYEIAVQDFKEVGDDIKVTGLNYKLLPLIIGITGKSSRRGIGNLNIGMSAMGAKEIIDYLRPIELTPNELINFNRPIEEQRKNIYVVYFDRTHTQIDKTTKNEQPDYFVKYLPYLSILLNCMKWNPNDQWRLVTKKMLSDCNESIANMLKVIGDITCDPGGSIEVSRDTYGDIPFYIYDPVKDIDSNLRWENEVERELLFETTCIKNSVCGNGIVMMTITNLPTQLPKEASRNFSYRLRRYIPDIARIRSEKTLDSLRGVVSRPIRRATMIYDGQITPDYRYLIHLYSLSDALLKDWLVSGPASM